MIEESGNWRSWLRLSRNWMSIILVGGFEAIATWSVWDWFWFEGNEDDGMKKGVNWDEFFKGEFEESGEIG